MPADGLGSVRQHCRKGPGVQVDMLGSLAARIALAACLLLEELSSTRQEAVNVSQTVGLEKGGSLKEQVHWSFVLGTKAGSCSV